MAGSGLANRLYQGEANINIVGRRKMWFTVAAALILVAIGSFVIRGFELGIEFAGGTSFSVPASADGKTLTQDRVHDAVEKAVVAANPEAAVLNAQQVGDGAKASYTVRASALSAAEVEQAKTALVADLGVKAE